ncbi:MAG: hypothetical protein ACRC14_04795 [Paracoccaceae bacterium]
MQRVVLVFLGLAGCVSAETPEGCPVMMTDIGQAYTAACQAAYYEEKARQQGQPVTRCFNTSGTISCTTQ